MNALNEDSVMTPSRNRDQHEKGMEEEGSLQHRS